MSDFIDIRDIMAELREGKREIANGTHTIAYSVYNSYLTSMDERDIETIEVCYANDGHSQIRARNGIGVFQVSNGNVYFEGTYRHVQYVAKMPLKVFLIHLDTRKLSRFNKIELEKIANLIAMYYYRETKKVRKSATIKAFSPYYIAKENGLSHYDTAAFDLIVRYVTTEHFTAMAKNAKKEFKKIA